MNDIKLYLDSARNYLRQRYGEIKPEWELTLMLLETSLARYKQVKEAIDEIGIYDAETGKKNQLLSTEKDLLATIFKLTQKLGLSPYDTAKIKVAEEDDADLLSAIMGEDE